MISTLLPAAYIGPTDPKRKKTSVAQAEADAKSFAIRRGLLTGEATHTGGVVPAVSFEGRPVAYGQPLPDIQRQYKPVPRDVTEFDYDNGAPYYVDPRTGNMEYFDPVYINLPQFRQKPTPQPQILAKK